MLCRTRQKLLREVMLVENSPPAGIDAVVRASVEMFLNSYWA